VSKFIDKNLNNFFTKKKGIYNLVNKGNASWFDIANKLKKLTQNNKTKIKKISFSNYKSKVKRPNYSFLSMNKTRKNFIVNRRYWQYELKEIIK
jgi:dTDP-4-dehydrorhamnose reductase